MSLDDLLDAMGESYYPYHEYGLAYAESNAEKKTAAKKAILTDLLEIIGEDEPKPDHSDDNAYSDEDIDTIVRNQLRQQLRDKVRKYCE